MQGYKNGYLTKTALTTQIKRVVAKTHKIKYSDVLINWLSEWREYKFPTGLIQKYGKIRMRSVGFKAQDYIVTQKKNDKWYMR